MTSVGFFFATYSILQLDSIDYLKEQASVNFSMCLKGSVCWKALLNWTSCLCIIYCAFIMLSKFLMLVHLRFHILDNF